MKSKRKKLIAGSATAVLLSVIANYIYDYTRNVPVINYIISFFKWLYTSAGLIFNSQIRIWVVLVILAIIYFVWLFYKAAVSDADKKPVFYNYTSDRFHNWLWKWDWKYNCGGWEVQNLTPYCNDCDVELASIGDFLRPSARCPACRKTFGGRYDPEIIEGSDETLKLIRAKANRMVKDQKSL